MSQRRESRFFRAAKHHKTSASTILEAIAQLRGGGAAKGQPTRMKILVRKEELKQVLEAIGNGRGTTARKGSAMGLAVASSTSLEQGINLMRRRQIVRAACHVNGRCRLGEWRPVLHSIPEESIKL